MDGNSSLLKQDVRGRVCVAAARREALLDEYERSGLSGPKFAALAGVKYQTFAWWRHERRKRRMLAAAKRPEVAKPSKAAALRLVEAVVAGEDAKRRGSDVVTTRGALQLHLPGGMRLEIGDGGELKLAVELLKALGLGGRC